MKLTFHFRAYRDPLDSLKLRANPPNRKFRPRLDADAYEMNDAMNARYVYDHDAHVNDV